MDRRVGHLLLSVITLVSASGPGSASAAPPRALVELGAGPSARDVLFLGNSRLDATFQRLASEQGIALVPVSAAWNEVRREHPQIVLYAADGSHPSEKGASPTPRAEFCDKPPTALS